MAELSPAAQAVLDAFCASKGGICLEGDPERLAAALEAVANELVPEEDEVMRHAIPDAYDQREATRAGILAIANELKNHD